MTEKTSWFGEPSESSPATDPRSGAWAARFRGAMLGGAIGDALGAGVRHRSSTEIHQWFGPRGVVDYLPVFGHRGAVTELTQLSVFTLEALLRAKAANPDPAGWLPTPVVCTNYLRWLYTQGVPWEFAMSAHLQTHSEPSGWLLECGELFSTRNPGGNALHGIGRLASHAMAGPNEQPPPSMGNARFADVLVWAAPTMVWSSSEELVFAAGAAISHLLTGDSDIHGATGLHADVLSQLIRGVRLWDAVSASETQRLGRVYCDGQPLADVRRAVHAAIFASRHGKPGPADLDVAFDTDGKPGELGIALASVASTDNFADALRMAVNQSADSSVTAALTGQLAGAIHGVDGIPGRWLEELELRAIIDVLCDDAAEAFAPPPMPKWAQRYVDTKRHFSGPLELPHAGTTQAATVDSERAAREPEEATWEEATEATMILPLTEARFDSEWEVRQDSHEPQPETVWESPVAAERVPSERIEPFPSQQEPPKEEWTAPAPTEWELPEPAEPAEFSPEPRVALAKPDAFSAETVSFATDSVDYPVPDFPAEHTEEPAEAAPKPTSGGHAKVEGSEFVPPTMAERMLGCLLGGALGNALGSGIEMATSAEIAEQYGPQGPEGVGESFGVSGTISSDIQMCLFTGEGMIRGSIAQRYYGAEDPLREVHLAYQRWLHTQGVPWQSAAGAFHAEYPVPDGWLIEVPGLFSQREPGRTVVESLVGFGEGGAIGSFSEILNDSKGAGSVVRVPPVALYSADPAEVFDFAARTAALTHGHPTSFHAAGALAVILQQALLGYGLDDGVWLALQVLETWEDHEETSAMLKLAVELSSRGGVTPQQIEQNLGGGWVGEQALAIAVCAAMVAGDDVQQALRVAVYHSGDSDTTGAICGHIVGALAGVDGLPPDWLAELELRDVLEQMALDCVAELGTPENDSRPFGEDWNKRYPVQWPVPDQPAESPTRLLPMVGQPMEQLPETEPAPASGEDTQQTPVPLASASIGDFPAPKPSPRRINGVMPGDQDG